MKPKEKAKELVDKYDETLTYLESKSKAKQCATIAVELALEFCNGEDMYEEFDKVLYLIKVKDEIKKL